MSREAGLRSDDGRVTGSMNAPATSTLPPSMVVVCGERMDALEQRCPWMVRPLSDLLSSSALDHPWPSYVARGKDAEATIVRPFSGI